MTKNEQGFPFPTSHERGVVYLAFGPKFLLMALNSAKTLKNLNPHIAVQIITNQKIGKKHINETLGFIVEHVTFIARPDTDNRLIKTTIIDYCVFEHSLYLDCDTYVTGDLSGLFEITESYDVSLRANVNPYNFNLSSSPYRFNIPYSPELFPHFNGGVFVFKKNKASKIFFKHWHKNFIKLENKADQPALVTSLYECRETLKYLPLPAIFNATSGYLPKAHRDKIVIVHYSLSYKSFWYLSKISAKLSQNTEQLWKAPKNVISRLFNIFLVVQQLLTVLKK